MSKVLSFLSHCISIDFNRCCNSRSCLFLSDLFRRIERNFFLCNFSYFLSHINFLIVEYSNEDMVAPMFPSDGAIRVNIELGQVLTLNVIAISAELKVAAVQAHKTHLISVSFTCIAWMNVIDNFIIFFKVSIIQCALALLVHLIQPCPNILKVDSCATDVKRNFVFIWRLKLVYCKSMLVMGHRLSLILIVIFKVIVKFFVRTFRAKCRVLRTLKTHIDSFLL